jgi:Flavin-binding monooxygenase-like
VRFADGSQEPFDAVVMATGFRIDFPFLPTQIGGWNVATTPPPYLRMMHPAVPSLFFIGLIQPIGCIWRLADYQARIAALRIAGRLSGRPNSQGPENGIVVDYHAFERDLLGVLQASEPGEPDSAPMWTRPPTRRSAPVS